MSDDPELSNRIRQHATRHTAPDALRAAIRAQVALAEAGRPAAAGAGPRVRRAWWASRWLVGAGGFAFGLLFALLVVPALLKPEQPIDATLVAAHVRALRDGPTEVASSDRHTVKPWFQGRIDYAPPVFDLADAGFPLVGGRTEKLQGPAVAALTYTSRRHVIALFVWPDTAPRGAPAVPEHLTRRGFNLLHWSDKSMSFWAVSDVERAELERFMQALQARADAP